MSSQEKFIDLAVAGSIQPDVIDDYVEAWHRMSERSEELASFLGLTDEEYRLWVEDASVLPHIIDARRQHVSLKSYLLSHV